MKSKEAITSRLQKIVKLPGRVWYGCKIGLWAIKNPDPLTESMFKMLSDLLALLMKVATEDKPYMTEIMITIDADVKQPLVHIWAGAGINADPHKRIKELIEENAALRERIKTA